LIPVSVIINGPKSNKENYSNYKDSMVTNGQ
jgi:hypothetical protein